MTIGQAARKADVNVETIRYYERQRLLPSPPRPPSGYRQYPEETVARIRFIKRAQELGFSLKEISDLLDLRVESNTPCDDVRTVSGRKIEEIDRKIQSLTAMKAALADLIASCQTRSSTGPCPILDALEKT